MANEKRSFLDIDMQKLVLTYLHNWWLIAIGVVLAAVVALIYTKNFVTPMYSASVTVYVNSVKAGEELTSISSNTLATAQRLVNTYINIIESNTVMTKVAEASELDITAGEIMGAMSATQVDNTELFKVHIRHRDPQLAAKIANAIAEVAPGEIERFVEGSSTKIIDFAQVPKSPSSPSVRKNCMIGGLVGAVLVLAYLTVRFLMDVRIKGEDELTALFGIPVLGQIPSFVSENSKRHNLNTYDTNNVQQKGGAK